MSLYQVRERDTFSAAPLCLVAAPQVAFTTTPSLPSLPAGARSICLQLASLGRGGAQRLHAHDSEVGGADDGALAPTPRPQSAWQLVVSLLPLPLPLPLPLLPLPLLPLLPLPPLLLLLLLLLCYLFVLVALVSRHGVRSVQTVLLQCSLAGPQRRVQSCSSPRGARLASPPHPHPPGPRAPAPAGRPGRPQRRHLLRGSVQHLDGHPAHGRPVRLGHRAAGPHPLAVLPGLPADAAAGG